MSSILAAKFLTPNKLVSAGYDRIVKVWDFLEDDDATSTITPTLELYGHKAIVSALDVHGSSSKILSASADHTIGIWTPKKSSAPPAPPTQIPSKASNNRHSAKRQKSSNPSSSSSTPQRGPLGLLTSHTQPVSDVMFAPHDPTVAYSTSWDHTLRTWDLTTLTAVDTRSTAHPLFALAALPALHLVAVGSAARHITLVDPRASATSIAAMTLRGHGNAVASLAPDPESAYGLVSASHDGTCRVWDVRSRRNDREGVTSESTYTIPRESVRGEEKMRVGGEGVKVFGVCWDKTVGIVSASEDKRVQINRGSGVTAQRNQSTS